MGKDPIHLFLCPKFSQRIHKNVLQLRRVFGRRTVYLQKRQTENDKDGVLSYRHQNGIKGLQNFL